MATTFDSISTGSQDFGLTITQSHEVKAGSNRIIFAGIGSGGSDSVVSVTFNGVALTRKKAVIAPATSAYEYILLAPDVGTFNLVTTFNSSSQAGICIAGSRSGIDQTTPVLGTPAGQFGLGTPSPYSLAIDASAGIAVDIIVGEHGAVADFVKDAAQSLVGSKANPPGNTFVGSMSEAAGVSSMKWSWGDYRSYSHAALVLNPIPVAATVPDAPTIGAASAGNGIVTISGTPPANNGGSAITSYTARLSPGALTATSATLPVTVTGATNGVAYTGTLHATNTVGNSAESAASNSVTPSGANVAPTFIGPSIANITGTPGVAITPVDVHAKFSDTDALSYYASPAGTAWPSGLVINQTTGIISGATAANATTGLKVRAIDTATPTPNFIDSNAFDVTIAAAGGSVTVTWPSPLKNINGGLRLGQACRIALFDKATDALVGRQTGLTTNATTGYPPAFTMAGPVAATQYRGIVIMDADGAEGIELVTPT